MRNILYLIILTFGIASFVGYSHYSSGLHYSFDPNSTNRVVVDIKSGMSAMEVANMLSERNLISSSFIFNLYLKQKGIGHQIKAGRMVLQENFQLPQIVDVLVEGKVEEIPVTVLEGWTIDQIAEQLESQNLTTKVEFLDCISSCEFNRGLIPEGYLEGYLYPDTYYVDINLYSDQRFIGRMIDNFKNRVLADEEVKKSLLRSDISFADQLKMASIVEREEKSKSARPTVAGILWNRYNGGAGLGADATVLYALGRTKGGLTYDDLQVDSPYNTRKYRGLPPTPICNPSLSSIKASINPIETNYWYYLHDSEGDIHYANTLEEHNINKAKYIR